MKTGDFDPSLSRQFKDAGRLVPRALGILVLGIALGIVLYFGFSHG